MSTDKLTEMECKDWNVDEGFWLPDGAMIGINKTKYSDPYHYVVFVLDEDGRLASNQRVYATHEEAMKSAERALKNAKERFEKLGRVHA